MMNRQEAFNKMWNGLKSQGWQASIGSDDYWGTCAYRGEEDRKCAVGWCIPDDKYRPWFDESNGTLTDILKICELDSIELEWWERAQGLHDNATSPEDMENDFRQFAHENGLLIPE